MPSLDEQHPDVWVEALDISRLGAGPHLSALAEFCAVYDSLYDNNQAPSARDLEVAFDKRRNIGGQAIFYRVFWGDNGTCGVVGALLWKQFFGPVLMALTGFGLPCGQGERDETAAVDSAIQKTVARSVDL